MCMNTRAPRTAAFDEAPQFGRPTDEDFAWANDIAGQILHEVVRGQIGVQARHAPGTVGQRRALGAIAAELSLKAAFARRGVL